jgi:hypothetical protein
MDASTSFNFNPLIKSNLNNLIDFISSFQNLSHQTADFFQQAMLILMRKHFEQHGIILNYDKWDSIIGNILSFRDNQFASFTQNEFDYRFRLNNIISSNNNMVLSFNDYIETIKNSIDPTFRNQFHSTSECKRNLLIFFNLPNLDSFMNDEELELLIGNLRDEPFAGDDFREAFRNLLNIDNMPINNLQEKLITLIKLKLHQHISTSKQQLMSHILNIERNCRFFFKIENWFIMLNLFQENFEDAREGAISFDEFVRYSDSFVRSLEQRDTLSYVAGEDESLHDRLSERKSKCQC